ncbi:MAG: hypothetical protein ACYSWW_28940 [Planctomycetota bacterium]|jgi:hypothetical protein
MFDSADTSRASSRKFANQNVLHIGAVNVVVLAAAVLLCAGMTPAGASSKSSSLKPLNRFPRMAQEYFVQSVRRIENRANQRRADLKTKADAEAYVRGVREKIQQSFGPCPNGLRSSPVLPA